MTTILLFDDCLKIGKYHELTNASGPSQILLDFIDYDSSMSQVIGLESFDTLSPQARHELLLNRFDLNDMTFVALETLTEDLTRHIENNDAEIAEIKASQKKGAGGFLGYLAGKFKNSFHSKVPTFEDAVLILKAMEQLIAIDDKIVSILPHTQSHAALAKFYHDLVQFTHSEDASNKKSLAAIMNQRTANNVLIEEANWSKDRLATFTTSLIKVQSHRATVLEKFNLYYKDLKKQLGEHVDGATRSVKVHSGYRYSEDGTKKYAVYSDEDVVDFNSMNKDGKLLALIVSQMAKVNRPFKHASGFLNGAVATISAKVAKQ